MSHTQDPIDRANSALAYLHAVDDLLALSSDKPDMHMVCPGNLSMLIGQIARDLDHALSELERQSSHPKIHCV